MILVQYYCARAISRGCVLLVNVCRGVGLNRCPVVWDSIFSCTEVGCKHLFVCVLMFVPVLFGVKRRQEAAVRYHAQGGTAGTP